MLRLSLLDNALDFITDAVEKLSVDNPDERSIKYSMLHLHSGVELLLKQRLCDEYWALIFQDIDKADRNCLESGDFISVGLEKSIERLKKHCNIDLAKYKNILSSLKKKRNTIEHYHLNIDKLEAVSVMVKVWSFILDFTHEHITLTDEQQQTIENIRELMLKQQSFIKERLKEIKPKISEAKKVSSLILECPVCLQKALPLQELEEETECLFCRKHSSKEEMIEDFLRIHDKYWFCLDPKEMSMTEPPLRFCPNCSEEKLYCFDIQAAKEYKVRWLCFNCGSVWGENEVRICNRCNEPFEIRTEEDDTCDDCWDYITRD